MARKTHLHFIIWSYESYDAKTKSYTNATIFNLIDTSIESARARVKSMMPANRIKVREVIEHFDNFPCNG
jgi:hypothetical protein